MKLIPAVKEDLEFGRKVHHEAYREMVTRQYGSWDEPIQDQFFTNTWFRHPHQIIVDEENDKCGYCAIERTDTEIVLREIAILPHWQGRGIGSRIINSLIEEGHERGMPVKLNVMKTNSRARKLYERLGFIQFDESDTHFLMERSCQNEGQDGVVECP